MSAKTDKQTPNLGELFNLIKQAGQNGIKGEDGWWQSYHYPETLNFQVKNLISFTKSALYAKCLTDDQLTVFESVKVIKGRLDSSNVEELAKALDARLVYSCNEDIDHSGPVGSKNNSYNKHLFFIFDSGALSVSAFEFNTCTTCVSIDKFKIGLFNQHYKAFVKDE